METNKTDTIVQDIEEFIAAAEVAKPIVYKSYFGEEYEEKPGEYNDYMVRAMSSDMYHLYVWMNLRKSNGKVAKTMLTLTQKMADFNTELMRMFDDVKGDRPIKSYFHDNKCEKFVKELIKIAKSDAFDDYKGDDVKKRIGIWIDRIMYQMSWAYALEQHVSIKDHLFNTGIREYDADGNFIDGLSEKDEEFVKILCDIRKVLLKALVKIPVDADLHDKCLDKLERLYIFTEAIVEGKKEELTRLVEEQAVS